MANDPRDDENGGELIPAAPEDRLPVGRLMAPFVWPNNTVCTVPLDSPEAKRLYIEMKNGESKPLSDAVNTVIGIVHFFLEPKRKVDLATGEVTLYPRFVLRCENGQQYHGGAYSVMAALADLLLFRPKLPWDPPERVCVQVKNLTGGKRVYNLLPVIDQAVPNGKKGGK